MAADHVVGIDLELGLGEDFGLVRKHQTLAHQLGVGLLRIGTNDDLSIEDAARPVGEDAFVDFATPTVRLRVIDRGVIVDEPSRVGEVKPVQRALDALAVQDSHDIVANQRATSTD